jgi:hypothetical protein
MVIHQKKKKIKKTKIPWLSIIIIGMFFLMLTAFGPGPFSSPELCGVENLIVKNITCDPDKVDIGTNGGTITIKNNLNKTINFTITNFYVKNVLNCTITTTIINPGKTGTMNVSNCTLVAGKTFQADISGTYNLESDSTPYYYSFRVIKKIHA